MSADRPITREDLAVLLASALGHDKSDEVVAAAALGAGISRTVYTGEDIRGIFEHLVKAEGLVGVVARFAVSRGDVEKLVERVPRPVSAPQIGRPELRVGDPGSSAQSVPPPPAVDIMHLITPALGTVKSREAIEQAAARRGVDIATGLSYSGALAVLDEMSKVEGIVGVVARFAKARFLLNPKA